MINTRTKIQKFKNENSTCRNIANAFAAQRSTSSWVEIFWRMAEAPLSPLADWSDGKRLAERDAPTSSMRLRRASRSLAFAAWRWNYNVFGGSIALNDPGRVWCVSGVKINTCTWHACHYTMHVWVLFTCWSDTALVDDGTCSKCYKNTLREEGKHVLAHWWARWAWNRGAFWRRRDATITGMSKTIVSIPLAHTWTVEEGDATVGTADFCISGWLYANRRSEVAHCKSAAAADLKSAAAADLRDAASKFAICSLHAKKHQRKRARVAHDDSPVLATQLIRVPAMVVLDRF